MKTPTGYKYQNFVYNIEYVPKRYLIKIHQLKIMNMHSESLHRQFKMFVTNTGQEIQKLHR